MCILQPGKPKLFQIHQQHKQEKVGVSLKGAPEPGLTWQDELEGLIALAPGQTRLPAAGRALATHMQCQKPVRRLTSDSSLCSREPGASFCCPALLDCRAAAPAVEEVAKRTVHDGDTMKEESFSALFYLLYLFPQLSPAEDSVGLGLHRDLDFEREVQQVRIHQPGGSVSQVWSSGAELGRHRHSGSSSTSLQHSRCKRRS